MPGMLCWGAFLLFKTLQSSRPVLQFDPFRSFFPRTSHLAGYLERNLPASAYAPAIALFGREVLWRGSTILDPDGFFEGYQRLWHLQNIPEAKLGHHLYRFGQMVGNMHASGFSHGDLKWDNILINPQQPAQVSLVDFDGSRVDRWVRSRRVLKDLRRFSRDFKRSRLPDGFLDIFMRGWHRQRYW